jgi:hypothetical protein
VRTRDVDECGHVVVVAGLSDHRSTEGVADQDDRPVLRVDDLAGGFGVARQREAMSSVWFAGLTDDRADQEMRT